MSDELTIQGVNPQQQYPVQKTSTMPYALGGAAIGAAAGWAGTSMAKSKGPAKTLEELVQEANGQDKVDLTSKKAALEKAEKELADAGKAVYDGAEKEALDKAIKARDEELARLTAEKKIPVKKGGEILPYDPKWSMTANEVTNYKNLYSQYEAAKNAFESSTNYTDLKTAIDNRQNAINTMYDDIIADAKKEIKPKSTRRKDIKSIDEYLSSKTGREAIEKAVEDNKINRLTNREIFDLIGGETNLLDTKKPKSGHKLVPVVYKDGTIKYAQIKNKAYDKAMSKKLDNVSEQVSDTIKEYMENKKKLENLHETVRDKIDKGVFRNAGVKRGDADKVFFEDLKANLKTFEDELKTIKDAKLQKNPGGSWSYDKTVQDVLDKYAVDKPEDAKKLLDAKLSIGRKYTDAEKIAKETLEKSAIKDNTLNSMNERMTKLKNSDKTLNNLEKRIKGQFKKFIGTETVTTTGGLTEAQAMEKDSYKKLAKIVEDKQAIYDKVAAEKGKVNETAKKTAQEAVEKAKSELDNLVNSLNNKVKGMSGKAKAAWIAGTAVAGALIGAGIVNSKNKKAEAAAKQFMA